MYSVIMNIKVGAMKLKNIDYRKLKPLQGDLKDLTERNYAKLKKSLKEKNLFAPLIVWERMEGEYFILDGHGRERLFQREEVTFQDGKTKSRKVPCLVIEAKDKRDAKQKILLLSSQFQTITQDGFDNFAYDLGDEWAKDSLNFDALKFLSQDDTEIPGSGGGEDDSGNGEGDHGRGDKSGESVDDDSITFEVSTDTKGRLLALIKNIKKTQGLETDEHALLVMMDFFENQND